MSEDILKTIDPALLERATPAQLKEIAAIYDAQASGLSLMSTAMKNLASNARILAVTREGEAAAEALLATLGATKTEEAAQ